VKNRGQCRGITSLIGTEDRPRVSSSYQRLENVWYVSSYTNGENTIYEKAFMGSDIISTFIIEYATNKQSLYGPMVDHISKTFKPGQTEL
jgi:hypothetical protein